MNSAANTTTTTASESTTQAQISPVDNGNPNVNLNIKAAEIGTPPPPPGDTVPPDASTSPSPSSTPSPTMSPPNQPQGLGAIPGAAVPAPDSGNPPAGQQISNPMGGQNLNGSAPLAPGNTGNTANMGSAGNPNAGQQPLVQVPSDQQPQSSSISQQQAQAPPLGGALGSDANPQTVAPLVPFVAGSGNGTNPQQIPASQSSGTSNAPLVVGILAVAGVFLLVAGILMYRRRAAGKYTSNLSFFDLKARRKSLSLERLVQKDVETTSPRALTTAALEFPPTILEPQAHIYKNTVQRKVTIICPDDSQLQKHPGDYIKERLINTPPSLCRKENGTLPSLHFNSISIEGVVYGFTVYDNKPWPTAKSESGRWVWVGEDGENVFKGETDDESEVVILNNLEEAKAVFDEARKRWMHVSICTDDGNAFESFVDNWELLIAFFHKK